MIMNQLLKKWTFGVSLLVTSLLCSHAQAGSCSISSVSGVSFGSYDVFDSMPRDSTGSVTVLCSGLGSGLISIELSSGNGATAANRYMLNGSTTLDYNLYVDSSHMSIWGDGLNGTVVQGPLSIADLVPTTWTVYGRIPAQQNVPAGSYTDSITVTVQF
jgi:spore coat protein U-like protein